MLETQPRFLAPSAGIAPAAPALWDPEAQAWVSHGELAGRVGRLASALARRERGLVFLFARNDVASVVAYLAAVEAGHAVALLEAATRPEIKQALLGHYQPEWVLEASSDRHDTYAPAAGTLELPAYEAPARHAPPHPALALLLTTSGSTGSPKFVRLSRANLEANAAAIRRYLAIDAQERAIASLPLAYAYGLSVLNSHLLAGASVVLTGESVLARGFWDTFERHACTSFAGVPYTYQILERIGFERFGLPTLRTMTQAGGRLEPALVAKYHAFMAARGGRFVPMYGQTEATARIAYMPSEEVPRKPGSVGLPIPGGLIAIERDGRPAARPYETGEVVYRGPNVMLGYAIGRDDLAKGDELDGRLATGDLGHLDDEGYLYLTGRLKRFAKLFGLRLNLDEIEALLRPGGPVAVLDLGDRLAIFLEGRDPAGFFHLQSELARQLRLPMAAFRLQALEALPLLPSGKIDYAALKERAV